MNLWELLTEKGDRASERRFHCWEGGGYGSATWPEVVRDAEEMTLGLRRAGLQPGDRVATVLTNSPHVARGILGVWLAGGVIASLPVPARGMEIDEYARQLERICEQLEPTMFLLEGRMFGMLPEGFAERMGVRPWESLVGSGRVEPSPPGQDEVAFIQYSSGSTSTPKGCMLTPRAIANQLELVRRMTDGQPGCEVGLSWLPLSHDMGVFGCLLYCWAFDYEYYLSTPERFMVAPRTWFGEVIEVGATLTAGTNTALYLGARALRGGRVRGELPIRACIIGAERIERSTLRFAAETLDAYGFREEALMPAYGLAEATLAVTATPVDEPPRCLSVDGVALADGEVSEVDPDDPAATQMVSAGVPCDGVELVGAEAERLGEIRIRSECLAEGYFADPELTVERFADGAVLSRDLGFVRDGHLYPVGRLDDVVVAGGRNVYACEVESAVSTLSAVRRGCSTLIDRSGGGGSRLTLLIELQDGEADYKSLAAEAARLAMGKAGVSLDECLFLERGTLPKTPTGKIQRHRCRQMMEAGRLEPMAVVAMGSA